MTKPVSYYVDANIPVVKDITMAFGPRLEGINQVDKIYLISELAGQILDDDEPTAEAVHISQRIRNEISEGDDAIALLKAIVNNL